MTETTTKYPVAKALKYLSGISKKRLYEMMNNGEISYDTEPWGSKTRRVIDASELARVFDKKFKIKETTETKQETVSSTKTKPLETIETTLGNRLLEQKVEFLTEQVTELKQERDDWKQQAQTLLLNAPVKSPQKPADKPKGFWAALLGKKE